MFAIPERGGDVTEATLGGTGAFIYVAVGGDDAAPGDRERPLATLAGARDAVRKLRRAGVSGPVEVRVRPGIFHLAEPLVLGPEDSGTEAGPTTYRAAGDGRVVLSGGVPLGGWRRRDDGLWAAPVPSGLDFRLLRVGDRWATRARHPNVDPRNPYTGGWLFADAADGPEPGSSRPGDSDSGGVGPRAGPGTVS